MNEKSNVVELQIENVGDNHKVREMVDEKLDKLLPQIIANIAGTQAKSALTLKVVLQYNKNDEVEVTVDGTLTLGSEPMSMTGEILNRQLRLW